MRAVAILLLNTLKTDDGLPEARGGGEPIVVTHREKLTRTQGQKE